MATQTTPSAEITASRKTSTRKRGYVDGYNPQAKTVVLLNQIIGVLNEFRDHWPLTARQIFYRLVGAHGADKSEQFYGKLCHHLAMARRGRLIPFDAIRDDGVTTYPMDRFADADAFRAYVKAKAANYRRDLMATQDIHIEVWCEAGGMLPQLVRIAKEYSIKCFSSGGFDSLTAKKDLADRICKIGKPCVVLHLGDFDPSGESIFNSVANDVSAFVRADRLHAMVEVEFRRIALTCDQVEELDLPTAPAKSSDSRAKAWIGGTCQLEALAPDQIAEILRTEILAVIDHDTMQDSLEIEQYEREQLTQRLLMGPASDNNPKQHNEHD